MESPLQEITESNSTGVTQQCNKKGISMEGDD